MQSVTCLLRHIIPNKKSITFGSWVKMSLSPNSSSKIFLNVYEIYGAEQINMFLDPRDSEFKFNIFYYSPFK